MTATPKMAHLHVHTDGSVLDGACKLSQMFDRAYELGINTVGITDHGSMTQVLKAQKAAKAASEKYQTEMKSIPGCEVYFIEDRRVKDPENRYYHLTLLPENETGYYNLCQMTAEANRSGYYYKPRVDYELLKKHGDGILVLTGCMASRTMQMLMDEPVKKDSAGKLDPSTRRFKTDKERLAAAREEVLRMGECVGMDNVYLEVQNVGVKTQWGDQRAWNASIAAIAKDLGRPTVGTGDVHYLFPEDADPHDVLLCVQTKSLVSTPYDQRMSLLPQKYYMRSYDEMAKLLDNVPESLATTLEIADRCNVLIETGRTFELLPTFPVPDDFKPDYPQPDGMEEKVWRAQAYLRHHVWKGLHERYGSPIPADKVQRAEEELDVINNMGVTDYFLILLDLYEEARRRNIPGGPGRGSGAGSIVLYALGVTQLCPIEHGLLFERFLNPDRISMPDVDMDWPPDQRGELMDYMREKYGEEFCAQIITFGRMGSKASIKRAAQAMGSDFYGLADKMSKAIPTKGTVAAPLKVALEESPELKSLVASNQDAKKIIDTALWMEGFIQNESVHAAAFIVSPVPVDTVVPVQVSEAGKGVPITAFDMKDAEGVGLLKLDFLGLRNLSVIQECERLIERTTGQKIDAWKVPLDDAKTYEMLAKGDSVGVFQFECVAGDTIINGDPRKTIAELYEEQPKHLLSIDLGEGRRRRNRVLKVVQSGEKQLWRLVTDSGFTLRASAEHKVLTADGWKVLGEITPADQVVVNRKDASRIGACTTCLAQMKSRAGKCTSCRNRERDSARTMTETRDHDAWLAAQRRGADSPWWGAAPPPAQLHYDGLDHPVRSHWEADFALAMIKLGEPYEYEPRTFALSDGSGYTPDFYLPARDLWVEIKGKGRLSGKGKRKFDRFRAEYPELNVRVVSSHQIAEFELANPQFAAWNCPQLPPHYEFEPVLAVIKDEVEMTYDIAMEAPLNNYIANGIVVHNSGGMQDSLRTVGADRFADLVAIVALYRPGPMAQIPVYARRKKGLEPVTYGDPRLEPILGETQGLVVYQEQSMLVARELAGFTRGEADTLRKAIGKKMADLMAELKPKFMAGCKKNGVDPKVAEELWAVNEASAEYSFNKSHAAAYALISYVTAYLKANYPTQYMSALLTSVMGTKDKVPFYLYETKKMGIQVLPPDINKSFADFEPEGDNAIRFGLVGLKGVGQMQVDELVAEREQNGPYKSLWDFCQRVPGANKKVLESLILAGALDSLGEPRKGLLEVIDTALKQAKNIRKKKEAGQDSLFDLLGGSAEDEFAAMETFDAPKIPQDEFEEMERFKLEREVAGLYVSGHPLDSAQAAWERVRQVGLGELTAEHISPLVEKKDPETGRKTKLPERTWTVAGIITSRQTLYTKKANAKFFKLMVEDLTGDREIMIWPRMLEQNPDLERITEPGNLIWGRIHVEEDTRGFSAGGDDNHNPDENPEEGAVAEAPEKQLSVSLTLVRPFDPRAVDVPEHFDVKLPKARINREFLSELKQVFSQHPGTRPVRLLVVEQDHVKGQYLMADFKVAPSDQLTGALRQLIAA